VIIPKFLTLDLPLTLTWLETLFGCIKPYRKILKENDLNYEVALAKEREKNVTIASILEVSVNDITEHIKNLNRDKRTAVQQINLMASNAESAFYSSMSRMKSILDLLKEDDSNQVVTMEAVPEESGRKKKGGKKKEAVVEG
jgi:predicted transcriptional regulator